MLGGLNSQGEGIADCCRKVELAFALARVDEGLVVDLDLGEERGVLLEECHRDGFTSVGIDCLDGNLNKHRIVLVG